MKPEIICLMLTSIDGRLGSGRSGEGAAQEIKARGQAFEAAHDELGGDGWIIGRVTGAEMCKATAHPPKAFARPDRSRHFANRQANGYAIIVDPSGRLHFDKADMGGEHVVVLLGSGVPDSHLAELAADGVSYVVSDRAEIDVGAAMELVGAELGVKRLLLEGGGGVNGTFLKAGLVKEIVVLVWPSINAITGERAIFEAGDEGLANALSLSLTSCENRDGVVWLRYAVESRTA